MATFIPGVTDYIPQIQPWKPDLNFYSKALQRKQSQYDVAYNKVSNMYGSLLNAEMIRPDNLEKRDDFFKGIDQQIKKISTMDLSLVQNEDSAMDLFRPFYEDDNIIKDMSYTKKVQAQIQRGNSYKDCTDPVKCNGQYWPEGLDYINIMADEFKNASPEDALKMTAPEYIPWQNVTDMATKFATANKLSITNISKDHGYIITEKNGVKGYVPLFEIFKAEYGNNPNVLQMFKVQGVLKRKGWINENLYKYNGDEGKALEAYIEQTLAENKKPDEKASKKAKQADEYLTAKQDQFNNIVETEGVVPGSPQDLQNRQAAADHVIVKKNLALNQNVENVYNSLPNSVGNLKSLRDKADYIKSNSLFNQGIFEAAKSYADATYTAKADVDQYALESVRNQHAKERDEQRQKNAEGNIRLHAAANADLIILKDKLKNGNTNSTTADKGFTKTDGTDAGGSTGVLETSLDDELKEKFIQQDALTMNSEREYITQVLSYITNGIANGSTQQQVIYKDNLYKSVGEKIGKQLYYGDANIITKYLGSMTSVAQANLFNKLHEIVESDNTNYGSKQKVFSKSYNEAVQSLETTKDYQTIMDYNSKLIRDFSESSDKVDKDDKDAFKKMFSPKGRKLSKEDYIKTGGDDDKYDDMNKIYMNIYKEGNLPFKSTNQSEGVSGTTGKSDFGGGIADFSDKENKKGTKALKSFLNETVIEKIILGKNPTDKEYEDAETSEAGKAFIEQMKVDLTNFNKTNRLVGTIEYHGVSANNPDLVAITIKPSSEYARKFLESENKKNILGETDFQSITENGITMIMKRENMSRDNLFKQWSTVGPHTIAARAGRPVNINTGSATKNYQITNKDGKITTTGSFIEYSWDNEKKMLIKTPNLASSLFDSQDVDYDYYVNQMTSVLEQLQENNDYYETVNAYYKKTQDPRAFVSKTKSVNELKNQYREEHQDDLPTN